MPRALSLEVRNAIVRGFNNGRRPIELSRQFNCTTQVVNKILRQWRTTGNLNCKKRGGSNKKTDRLTDRTILRMSRNDPRLTAVDIQRQLGSSTPSVRTIRRRLQDAGLNARRPAKKPMISKKNRDARIKWAIEHLNWTREQWNKVLFSDESKFNLFGSDGIAYVRRPAGKRYAQEYQLPTIKHGGGSIMVWGCFSGRGVGPLLLIEGNMDRFMYEGILENTMRPYALDLIGRGFVFQQDNDPKHRSVHVSRWFTRRHVTLMEWPSQSPDLNPIEHMWEELKRRLRRKMVHNKAEKFKLLEQEWRRIPMEVIDQLLESMPRRCQAVIDSKGYPTKY